MKTYDFSVIVLCYEPDIDELKQTLFSIIQQTGISYEIVIADDGSKLDYKNQVIQWFEEKGFFDYKLVFHQKNQGTVRNLLGALAVAEGRYTKNISPGDFLYASDALHKMKRIMDRDELKVAFGKAAYYSYENGETILYNRHSPVDPEPYRQKNPQKIRQSYFMFRDYILGATFAFDLEAAKTYTNKIAGGVTYAEDTAVIAMLAAGEKMGMLDDYAVWYEFGTGISTNANSKWANIIFEENKYVFQLLSQENKEIQRAYQYHFVRQMNHRFLDTVRKMIQYPPYIAFMVKAIKVDRGNGDNTADIEKLKHILNMEG